MSWIRYSGRILLAIAVLAIAWWATANKLLPVAPYQFWIGILSYLVAAEVSWTLVERKTHEQETALPRRGVLRLSRRDRARALTSRWFQDGGRVRMADAMAGSDSPREALLGVLPAVMARVSGPRLHLLSGGSGTGRSTLLCRLARALYEAGQTVFVVLPTPELLALDKIIEVARRQQVYVLIDDLDLRPEAEEWLYELERFGLPVVVVAVTGLSPAEDVAGDGLAALRPANLLAHAVIHDVSVQHGDVVALARSLNSQVRLEHVALSLQELDSLYYATRVLQGRERDSSPWVDLDQGPALPPDRKLMLALCGAAEMAFTEPLWAALFGAKTRTMWQKAGLAVADSGLMLPPHRLTCLDLIAQMLSRLAALPAALDEMCRAALPLEPAFVARLMFALAQMPQTRSLARAQMERLQAETNREGWPAAIQRLWRRADDALGLPADTAALRTTYPPETSFQAHAAFARRNYEQALALSRRLTDNPIYQPAAHFNVALALAHLGDRGGAEQELGRIEGRVPGMYYLRAVLAEMNGDVMRALDEYAAARKADELPISSTRRLAFAYLKSGAPRAAIPLFEAALAVRPRDPELYGGLAVGLLHSGMAQRAAAQSARAIQAGVDPMEARRAVARACAAVHAYDRAAAELEGCLAYDSSDISAWQALSEACRFLGRYTREDECLRRLQAAQPRSIALRLQMARCLRDQGRAQEAYNLLEQLLKEQPAEPEALLLAAETAGACGRRDLQESWARQALEQGDRSGWAHYWLADSQAELNDTAREAYAQALVGLQRQLQEGLAPRRSATIWQAIYVAASKLGEEDTAAQAVRQATQEAAICDALHAEIDSVAHHRAVPPEVFLESLPPYNTTSSLSAAPPSPAEPPRPTVKPVTAPSESSVTRNRQTGRSFGTP